MKNIKVRLACENDLDKILQLHDQNIKVSDLEITDNESVLKKIRDREIYIAEDDNENFLVVMLLYNTFYRNEFTFISIFFINIDNYNDKKAILKEFIHLCFDELNLNKVNVEFEYGNQDEIKCFIDCGFKIETISKEKKYRHGYYEDMAALGITKSDYLNHSKYCGKMEIKLNRVKDEDSLLNSYIKPNTNLLTGSRVDLANISKEDIEKIYPIASVSDEQSFASLGAYVPMTYQSLIRYADHYNDYFDLNGDIIFGIKKKDGTIIGTVSADTIDRKNRNTMIGITIYDKNERGKGYGSEAMSLLLDFLFLELNMHRVYFGCFSFNKAGLACYKKLNIKDEGVNRQFLYRNGIYYDEIQYGVIKKDWLLYKKSLKEGY